MSYGFTRLVCLKPPTRKEILEWNPDLDEVAVSILLQLLRNEYIQNQEIHDQDSPGDSMEISGINSLTRAVRSVLPRSEVVWLGFCGMDQAWAVIQLRHTQKPAIVFYHYKEAYNIELITEAELIEKMKGI